MMIRSYDLSIEKEVVEQMINDPHLMLQKYRVGCGESGFTTATLYLQKVVEPIERKRHRVIERFILFDGTNQEVDRILEDKKYRVLRQYEFITEQGVIIVLDYEF